MVTSQGEMKNPAIQKQDLGHRGSTHFARRGPKGPHYPASWLTPLQRLLTLALHLVTVGFAGVDRDLHAAISLPSVIGVVRRNWLGLASTLSLQSTRRNSKRLKV